MYKGRRWKINLGGLLYYAEQYLFSIGIYLRWNKVDYKEFLESVKKEIERDNGINKSLKHSLQS